MSASLDRAARRRERRAHAAVMSRRRREEPVNWTVAVFAVVATVAIFALTYGYNHLSARVDHQAAQITALERAHSGTTAARAAVQRTGAQRNRCAYGAASCVTTPYRSGPYGPGSAGTGLLIRGSKGMGGTPLMVTDSGRAPEVWISDGTLYVLTKPGWLGRGICIDVALRHDYCLSARDIIWTHKHDGGR